MKIIKPPQALRLNNKPSIFLAGSIDQGEAVDWQAQIIDALSVHNLDIVILNPRRDSWDPTWDQNDSNLDFVRQVNWELNAMDKANMIVMHFAPKTKAPVSMLELGLYADKNKLIVCCPDGYWRKGNVDIICKKYKIKQVDTVQDLTYTIITRYK